MTFCFTLSALVALTLIACHSIPVLDLSHEVYIKASNTDASDEFDRAMAFSSDGSTLAVGAPGESSHATGVDGSQTDNSAYGAGAVYVFTHIGGSWSQQAYVKASNTDAPDVFGIALALSSDGSTLAVGAINEESGATGVDGDQADNTAPRAGAVYVFNRTRAGWSQQAYLKASNAHIADHFGGALSLSADGSILAVGAADETSSATGVDGDQSDHGALSSGAVYVFAREGTTWSQQAYVKASNTGGSVYAHGGGFRSGDHFGSAVALSADGSTLAVGAATEASSATGIGGDEADNSVDRAGAAYVFVRVGTSWSQQAYIKASNTDLGDNFGAALALSSDGSTLAVGAPWEASSATGIAGNQADNSLGGAGAAYVFTRGVATWSQQVYLKASNTHSGDGFGDAVALSTDGSVLAVGSGIGTVYVFARAGTWSQQAYVTASNPDAADFFGFPVALSSDGSALAVGAQGEDSSATGIGGDRNNNAALNAGAAYVYY